MISLIDLFRLSPKQTKLKNYYKNEMSPFSFLAIDRLIKEEEGEGP
jgi:hypothetical protein